MSLVFDLELPRRDFLLSLQGEFSHGTIGIFGSSGAGKTSFFSLLAGLEKPRSGKILLNGRTLTDTAAGSFVPVHKRRIGVVFQDKLMFPHMTIKENLLFGVPYARDKKISFDDVVDLLDLSPMLDSMPHEVSGGEQQRTAIGRALLTSPELLLLDEPFNAVDNTLRYKILPYLRKLGHMLSIPMLVISHDLPDIQKLTNRVYLIEKGVCRGDGNLFDLLEEQRLLPDQLNMVNTFELYSPREESPGLYTCSIKGMPGQFLKIPRIPSERFTASVQPNEIALSKNIIDNISMQNQIRGTILQIRISGSGAFCLIQAGVKILVEVTTQTIQHMQLREGTDVTCLFKAHSLKCS